MYTNLTRKPVIHMVKEAFNAPVRKFNAFLLGLLSAMMVAQPTLCVKINSNLSLEGLMGGIVDFIIQIFFYVGVLLAIGGIAGYMLAQKNDNTEAQANAARAIVVGAGLVGFDTLLVLAGIITL